MQISACLSICFRYTRSADRDYCAWELSFRSGLGMYVTTSTLYYLLVYYAMLHHLMHLMVTFQFVIKFMFTNSVNDELT